MVNRGSEWRKWDFHVHTKDTNKNDQFKSQNIDEFFAVLFKAAYVKSISGIGITDYFSIDRYLDAIKYVKEIDSKIDSETGQPIFSNDEIKFIKTIFLFPNVELRMLPATDKGRLINIHCLFNPNYVENLEHDFFGHIENQDGKKMNRYGLIQYGKSLDSSLTTDLQQYKKGIDNFVIDLKTLKSILSKNKEFKENCILVVSNSNNDGASAMQKHFDLFENEEGALDGLRKSIYQISDCIFSANPKDIKYFLGKRLENSEGYNEDIYKREIDDVINKTGSLKPCIVGCDAHTEKDLFNRLTWIKSELSFEGLRQIIYEPAERVRIQNEMPEGEKLDNLMIEKVTFSCSKNRFTPKPIYFSKNLNVIIGGKSSGKSILLYEIAKTLYSNSEDEVLRYKDIEDNQEKDLYDLSVISNSEKDDDYNFCVSLYSQSSQCKKDRSTQSSILPSIKYIPQNHLSNLVDRSRKNGATLKNLIRDLILEHPNYKTIYDDFVNYVKKNDEQRNQDIDYYYSLKSSLEKKESELLQKGDTKALREGILFNRQKIDQLNKDFTPEELIIYKGLTEKLNHLKIKKNQVYSDFEKLDGYQTDLKRLVTELSNKKRITIDSIQNEVIKTEYSQKLKFVDEALLLANDISKSFIKTDDKRFAVDSIFEKELQIIESEIEVVTNSLLPYNQKLENEKQTAALQKSIGDDEAKISEIEQLIKEIENTKNEIVDHKIKIFNDFKSNFNLYTQLLVSLQPRIQDVEDETDKIKILPTIKYNFPKFRHLADRLFDGRGFNNRDFDYIYQYWDKNPKSALADADYDEIERSLKVIFDKIERKQLLPKGGVRENDAIKQIFTDFFFDHWDVQSEGDDIHKMSTGKASFVLLKLIIKLSKENGPILIDQPEDNLDNRSVSKALVDFIKDKKRDRQIILVTHNPNIVVNADAENVIVANQIGQNDIVSESEYKFDYINGALENSFPKNDNKDMLKSMGIKEHIADIVEGGKEAFKKREIKYGFK